jgi:putative glutamine amidotransferase
MQRPKIIITQRRDKIDGRNEWRDALDVRLSTLFWELGFLPLPISSGVDEKVAYVHSLSPDGFVLSGGGDLDPDSPRDQLENKLLDYAIEQDIPVLGICRGMQVLNAFQGGTLQTTKGHTAVNHQIFGAGVNIGRSQVNSFHDFGIHRSDLGRDLEVLAEADDGVIESVKHREYNWLGIMWHPERDEPVTESDKLMIRNHFLGNGV